MTITVSPELLVWSRTRAGLSTSQLAERLKVSAERLETWEAAGTLTLKQLERIATATHTPVGYLFLQSPPVEELPIPDYRTIGNRTLEASSIDLLDVTRMCQQRQSWYRAYLTSERATPLSFVGSISVGDDVERSASTVSSALQSGLDERRRCGSWTEAFRHMVDSAERIGVLVMCSGVVGNNTHRKLDPNEFRGFAMVDDLAPLVFVNGADSKSAQMFTLAHELVHIWSGSSAVSGSGWAEGSNDVERWCNRVAAELLVPSDELRRELARSPGSIDVSGLARAFKVSSFVVLLRLFELGRISRPELESAYEDERKKVKPDETKGGGDFYNTEAARVSKRFARALLSETLSGRTLFRDALQLLSISSVTTLRKLGDRLLPRGS